MMTDWDTWGDTRPLLIGGTDFQRFLRVSPPEEDGRMEVHPPMAAGSRAADQLAYAPPPPILDTCLMRHNW